MESESVCTNGSIKPTNHKTIMKQLRIHAERFRKQGRLRDKDLEEIIAEIKANDRAAEEDADKTAFNASNKENRRVCVCVWPPVSGELLSSMRYLSLVLTFMTSLHTLRLGSTPPLVSLGSLLEKFPTNP